MDFNYGLAVEVVGYLVALDEDAGVIPLADRADRFVSGGTFEVVEGGGTVGGVIAVDVFGVVEDLVF